MFTPSPRSLVVLGTLWLGTSSVSAQCLDPNIGLPTGSGPDTVTACGPLGFDFTFPSGQSYASIAIDSNGRIFPVGADVSDFTPTVTELVNGTTALCPLWADLGLGPVDDVYCSTNGVDTAVITWVDARAGAPMASNPFSFQAVLRADGSFRFAYDERLRTAMPDGIVAYTSGNGFPGTQVLDWADSLLGPAIDSGSGHTAHSAATPELAGVALEFVPNGNQGYTTTASVCGTAFATQRGDVCTNPAPASALTFTPNFASGYSVHLGSGSLINIGGNFGTSMGHGDETLILTQLGFTFTMPDDTPIHMVDVDSNGRILVSAVGAPDFNPTINEFLSPFHGQIAVFWTDLDPSAGGDMLFGTNGTDLAIFTWLNVPQWNQANAITVQAQLRADNSITIVLEDTTGYLPVQDLLVGISAGFFGGSPSESNFSLPLMLPNPAATTHYEFFDRATNDIYDLQRSPPSPRLDYATRPIVGNSFDLTLDGMMPSNLGSFLMIGFSNLGVDLGILGIDCTLYSDNAIPAVMIGAPGQTSATFSLPIAASGVPLVMQGAVVQPGINQLGLDLTGAVDAVTGL